MSLTTEDLFNQLDSIIKELWSGDLGIRSRGGADLADGHKWMKNRTGVKKVGNQHETLRLLKTSEKS